MLKQSSKALLVLFLVESASGQTNAKTKLDKSSENMSEQSDVIKTIYGPVQGKVQDGVVRFLGIPYAQSIAGRNRFVPPKPIKPWTEVFLADQYANSSPQQASDPTSSTPVTPAFETPDYVKSGDNCLALNIWAPKKADGTLPVMVWLHGGGWTSGSGSCKIYDGQNLASRGDVIVITINHRLGASGLTDFSRVLGGQFANSSNLGIRDIIAALQWVHDNIAAFGGNPNLVTIFGESGGGWKVNTLLGVPSAKGLFQRAIVESGPLTRFLTPDEADILAKSVLNELGVSAKNADTLNYISFEDIQKAEAKVLKGMSFKSPGFPTGFWPVMDGDIIPGHVFDTNAAISSLDVPLLMGTTGTEFTLFMLNKKSFYSLTNFGLKLRLKIIFRKDASNILKTYKRDFPDYDPSGLWFRIFSDFAMGTLSSHIMDVRSVPQAAPVYAYRFDWQTPIYNGKLYSPHTIEIPFVFNNVNTEAGIIMTGGSDEAIALAKKVSNAWVEFAKTGKPIADGLPEWPAYSPDNRQSMHFNITSTVAPFMDAEMVKLFHKKLWEGAGLN